MSTRSERIKSLVEQSKLSYQELEKLTGIKKSSLQRYASGTTAKIPLDVIEKLSNTFNVSQEYLMGWSDKKTNSPEKNDLSEGEKKLLAFYRGLSSETREVFDEAIYSFESFPEETQKLALRMLRGALGNQ
jgi:transcriptional regulator with XRE-family HTH domain